MKWYTLIATWFGSGRSSFAPGTMGSLATLPLAYLIHVTLGWQALIVGSVIAFVIGVKATELYLKHETDKSDPGEVVIDEVAGQMLTLAFLAPTITSYLLGFFLFRLFDVVKPWPIGWLDKNVKGAMGVMVDDMVAGLAAPLIPALTFVALCYYDALPGVTNCSHQLLQFYVP